MTTRLDRSAPGVRITLLPDEKAGHGEPLDLGRRLIAFTFEDTERRADKVTLQLDNFDLAFFARDDLVGGRVLEVSWGYPGNMSVPRRVVLRKLKGFSVLTVEGQALSVLMHRETQTRNFENVTRAEVAKKIAQEHAYEAAFIDVDDTHEVFDVISQCAETDAHFLRRLAVREGFEFYVDDNGFHFHARRQNTAGSHVFTWYAGQGRGDVLSVSVTSDLVRRTGKVTVRGRDPLQRRTVEASATATTVERSTLGEVIEVVDPETGTTALETRNATATAHPTSATTGAHAQRESEARFRRAEGASVKLSVQVVGDPTLHAKSIVEMRGISSLLSGKYYVREVKHTISSSGYVCDLDLTRDGMGRRAHTSASSQRPQGGARNMAQPHKGGAMREVEVVDPESGRTSIAYRRDRKKLGAGDPEASR